MPLFGSTAHQDTIAGLWILFLLISLIGYLIYLIKSSDYDLWESVLYTPTYLFGRLLWRVHFANSPPAELRSGGAILVSNHRSSVDPFFIQLAAKRRVHWMVAREYCQNNTSGPILRLCQVIPTNRSGMDNAATKTAIRLANSGRLVGMFPEGQLNHTRDPLIPIRSGAALVALRAGVPIIPLWLEGSPYRREVWSPLGMPAHVKITFGVPITTQTSASQNAAADSASIGYLSQSLGIVESCIQKVVADSNPPPLSNATVEVTTNASDLSACESKPSDVHSTVSSNAMALGEDTSAGMVDLVPTQEPMSVRRADLIRAEQFIMEWARQVVALSGHKNFQVRMAGRSRLERK